MPGISFGFGNLFLWADSHGCLLLKFKIVVEQIVLKYTLIKIDKSGLRWIKIVGTIFIKF